MSAPTPVPYRRLVYRLLILIAVAAVCGRILAAELVYEPSLSQPWPEDPGHPRRSWPATPPRPMPTFSSNDRSRWAAVRALVDHGTWVVGKRDRQVVLASAPAALAATGPLDLTVLLEAGYDRRTRSDTGIIFEDGWQSVDKMLDPVTLDFYSTKPPLLTFLVACEYWVLEHTLGWSLEPPTPGGTDQRFAVVRTCLLTFNALPFAVYLWLLALLAERFGTTDWGRLFVVAAACFGTLLTPFLISLNNHTLAACSAAVAVYAAVRILTQPTAHGGWFLLAGFFAGFTMVNELPAAAFAAGLGLLLLVRAPGRTLLLFVPAALLPVAAMLALNYGELGELDVGYSKFGGPWYEYEGSHWRTLPGQIKRGIDFAAQHESRGAYAFHLLLGHHGLFSLTPILLLALAAMAAATWKSLRSGLGNLRPQTEVGEENRRVLRLLGCLTAALTVIVVGFYLVKSDNYGGWSAGPRWLLWLTPLWLLVLLPVADWLGTRRWGRGLAYLLLAFSVLSVSYPAWNPWRMPWLYNWMEAQGWIRY